ncbi:MAG: hypothetical protein IJ083_10970 [Clostridia bacterium]|nr:hypothetical protein [Clostridia bacterium]
MDLTRGTGSLQLYRDDGTQVFEVNFQDEDLVSYRDMTENEMQGLRWGSGMVFEIHLPVSLELGENYHVAMDQGCIVGVESNVPNPHISNRGDDVQKWTPWVQGDFGVSGLRYLTDQEDRGISEDEETGLRVVVSPEKDDVVQFDLVLGGAADTAIIYCPDNSVLFEQTHFTYSTTVSAKVIADEVTSLGVMFMDEDGNLVQWVDITPITLN